MPANHGVEIGPLIQIVRRQAGGANGRIIDKQNECSRDCQAHGGRPLGAFQYVLKGFRIAQKSLPSPARGHPHEVRPV